MTQDERNQVGTVIAYTAQYYGRELKREVIAMMVSDLEDLSSTAVLDAFNRYRKEPKHRSFPLPAQIREMVSPTITPDAEARELLGRVKNAITQFGYTQGEAAKTYIGEIGWQIVRDGGGWFNLCNSDFLTNDSMQAQARNRLVDLVTYGPKLSLVRLDYDEKEKIEAPAGHAAINNLLANIKTVK